MTYWTGFETRSSITTRARAACILVAFTVCCVATTCHAANPIYDALIGPGVKVSEQETLQLPKPALEEGLTAAQQRQLIETLLGGKYDWETFTRKSIVSPFILKLSEGAAESGPIIRKSDIYFIAFGSFDSLHDEDYLVKQLNLASNSEQSETTGHAKTLTADELALFERGQPARLLPVHGQAEAVDVTGAGDTVGATFAVALGAGASALEAARLANVAGALVVQKQGTATVSREELEGALEGPG